MTQPNAASQSDPEAGTESIPATAPLRASSGPATVINPERRRSGSTAPPSSTGPFPDSGIWRRLFPPDDELRTETESSDPQGIQLGHFEIVERIGAGGMGAVFRAHDQRLKRDVALKVLSPALSRDQAAVGRFLNEARAAAQLDDDHIARVYYEGEDRGLHYIAFEYVIGTNVRELIHRHGRLQIADAVNYTLQIATALKHTAAAGVVHRDIKPSNIIITPMARAKLVDLGLARKESTDSQGDLTLAGTTLGTFDYISPEQAKDPRNVDVRSDIYSLGCTLYHMLTGEPPYSEGTVLQKLLDHQGKEPPDPAAKNRRVPLELSAVIKKMMASDPKHRYASADALIRDLLLVAYRLGLRGVHPEAVVWGQAHAPRESFWMRHAGWLATVAMLLFIVALLEWMPATGTLHRPATDPSVANNETPPAQTEVALSESPPNVAATDSASPTAGRRSGTETGAGTGGAAEVETGAAGRSPANRVAEVPEDPATAETPSSFNYESLFGQIESIVNARPPVPRKTPDDTGDTAIPAPTPTETGTDSDSDSVASASDVVSKPPSTERGDGNGAGGNVTEIEQPSIVIDGTERSFPTLESACEAAQSGDVIVLRYNGRRPGPADQPLRIVKDTITIRAADGFRPLIEFEPADNAAFGETRMITLVEAKLDVRNVDFRMRVRDDIATDQWVLFSLQSAERLSLDGVTATIENPRERAAAVVELLPGPDDGLSRMDMPSAGQPELARKLRVQVANSVVRTGGNLIHSRQSRASSIEIQQSLLALDGEFTNGSLIVVDSVTEMSKLPAALELRLDHVTCLLGNSLLRLSSEDGRSVLPVEVVDARNNLISAKNGDSPPPLVTMFGSEDVAAFRSLLRWNGEKNFYDRFTTFWAIQSEHVASGSIRDDFAAWQQFWKSTSEIGANIDGIIWSGTWREQPAWELLPADANMVADPSVNAAVKGASDGTQAGADLTVLPIPADERRPDSTERSEIEEPDLPPVAAPREFLNPLE